MIELPEMMFENKVTNIAKKTQGTLIIKEYPTASAHSGHFKALLNELALKKSFKPDIIFIDYLNICASSRYRANSNVNSYSYIKAIAEELRGLAVETNVPIVSATQTTRSFGSSDVDLTDTSESFQFPATADLMFALISTEELEDFGQIMVKQLKNRYHDPTLNKRFVIGVDRAKMKLYDCEQRAQDDIIDSGQEVEYNSDKSKMLSKFDALKILIMSGDFNTHNNQQPHINYAGTKVDLDKYALFVDGVTSDPSKDYQSFLESLSTLDGEGSNIHRLSYCCCWD